MIFTRCNFFSKILCGHVDVDILLPSMPDNDCINTPLDGIYAAAVPYPVLYLLHGALDDHTQWMRHTEIEDYAERAGFAVVMPSGQNGFYSNARYGLNYFDFVTEELPRFVCKYFPVSKKPTDTYIAGASMGGYGASKCALSKPERYAAFACLSGAVDPIELEPKMRAMGFGFFRYDLIFGGVEKIKNTPDDLFWLAAQRRKESVLPKAFVYCGLDDPANYQMNVRFWKTLTENGFHGAFTDGCGAHDYPYWNRCLCDFLQRTAEMRRLPSAGK